MKPGNLRAARKVPSPAPVRTAVKMRVCDTRPSAVGRGLFALIGETKK